MSKALIDFIVKRPLFSHALLSFVDLAILGLAILHPAFGAIGLWIAATAVSLYYYAREAGQREHDLKNLGKTPVMAWLGATFMFGWSKDNVEQWVVPTVTVFAASGAYLVLRLFV